MVVSVVMSIVAGVVVERLGVRLCLAIGSPVLGLTWVMIGQATEFSVLLVARIIQGLVGEHLFLFLICKSLLYGKVLTGYDFSKETELIICYLSTFLIICRNIYQNHGHCYPFFFFTRSRLDGARWSGVLRCGAVL